MCGNFVCVCVCINWRFHKFQVGNLITNSGMIAGIKLFDSKVSASKPGFKEKPSGPKITPGTISPPIQTRIQDQTIESDFKSASNPPPPTSPWPYIKRSRRQNSRLDICLNCVRNHHFSHFHSSSCLNQKNIKNKKKERKKNWIPNLKVQEWKKLLF